LDTPARSAMSAIVGLAIGHLLVGPHP
jgi:hypothetical protein